MRPFNLERALAGDPVQTRDGRTVHEVVAMKTVLDSEGYPLRAVVGAQQTVCTYTKDGRYTLSQTGNHAMDLVMAPVKKEGWVNLYRTSMAACRVTSGSRIYQTEAEAKQACENNPNWVATVKLEWEVDA